MTGGVVTHTAGRQGWRRSPATKHRSPKPPRGPWSVVARGAYDNPREPACHLGGPVEASPGQITKFFDGAKQMLVPLFQRPYEWGPKEWETLWIDLLEQYERPPEETGATHFTGAIVTAPARSVPVGVSKFLVIDGQQRLTTVAILICAIRSLREVDTPKFKKLTTLLVNEHDEGLDYYKLLPTQPDRPAFQALVKQAPLVGTRFTQAFEFFRKRLTGPDSEGETIDLDRMTTVLQGRLIVVMINLGEADDPYLIFESLNAKGAPLTQADLIRNYLLLRFPQGAPQQAAYENAWLPMQELLGDHLTEFMRQYLMMAGDEVAKSSIYAVLKQRLMELKSHEQVAAELERLSKTSVLYAQIVGLRQHADAEIQDRLDRLRRWEVATSSPLVLKLLEAHARGDVTTENVQQCLTVIESYTVRRAVCAVPTNQLKRVFLALAKEFANGDAAEWLRATLAGWGAGRRWPKDEEFKDGLLRYRAYGNPVDRCKFILEALEDDYGHKERAAFSNATIEHIMPQSMTEEWQTALGPTASQVHERWLDVIGNLTLTAYNAELSNSPFAKKKTILADSHFELNKEVIAQAQWTEQEITARTAALFKRAKRIWARPE